MSLLKKIDIEETFFALGLNYPSTPSIRKLVESYDKEHILQNLILSKTMDVRGYLLEVCWAIAIGNLVIKEQLVSDLIENRAGRGLALFVWGAMLLKGAHMAKDPAIASRLEIEAMRLKLIANGTKFHHEMQKPSSIGIIMNGEDSDYLQFGIVTIAAQIELVKHHAVS